MSAQNAKVEPRKLKFREVPLYFGWTAALQVLLEREPSPLKGSRGLRDPDTKTTDNNPLPKGSRGPPFRGRISSYLHLISFPHAVDRIQGLLISCDNLSHIPVFGRR